MKFATQTSCSWGPYSSVLSTHLDDLVAATEGEEETTGKEELKGSFKSGKGGKKTTLEPAE